MRLHLITALAFAAVTSAQQYQYPDPGSKNQQFTLLMTRGVGESRTNLSLTAVKSEEGSEVLLLVGEDPVTCVGTPAYLNASLSNYEGSGGEHVALQLDVEGQRYGVSVPPIGGMHGIAYSVAADKDSADFKFQVVDNEVFYQPSSGASVFLGCDRDLDGETRSILSWGSAPFPQGCWPTSVHQRCNIEGSSVKCN
ncbi:hypothetical protein CLAFUW4_01900 [Fulvia fulva]|uniref:Uncharacterized protein n=1 Tax=Passalora fulva TaxID=5499 RepID=A0A9Q8P4M3_PASFU|nr:uncharacterized protein CLAFUR5_01894 [Fulvia fulva]KAK4635164.1 hypothetical protein CLAFUR4_01895 [Fulvia fulva]KAK4637326.1 hypothetical protein CLAFUR0_01897 [Fulvia fulva]UJO12976.1 hypothetical protein CLAFUR5_01894 [Fulvia fulva]WPV08303.1 hypothetical protein CLAFUW4_01900 [Fulvia fulva]WPV23946.1 hypothetical protein CLAFUW7_01899 [Fulvia fulva]